MFSKYINKRNLAFLVAVLVFVPAISFGSSLFFVDEGGNIGLGNSNPAHKLDVSGAMYSRMVTATSSAIDWNLGNVQSLTLSSSPTLTFSNGQAGGEYKLILNQDATGGRTVTWPSAVKWPGGSVPILTSGGNSTDIVHFVYNGASFLGSYQLDYESGVSSLVQNLIAYWKLDESNGNATDAKSGYSLVNINNTPYISGKINNAADFEYGDTQYMQATTTLGYTGSGPLSISAWFKAESLTGNHNSGQGIVSLGQGGSPYSIYGITVSSSGIEYHRGRRCVTQQKTTYDTSLGTSSWHHAVMVWDGSNMKGYLDGALVTGPAALGDSGSNGCNPSDLMNIGTFEGVVDSRFDGIVDEVGVWSKALSASEVTQLYNSGSGRQYPF